VGEVLWRLIVSTVASCMRYRVTGLAGEAAFFAVLSVPPLVFMLAGGVGIVSDRFTPAQIADVRAAIIDLSQRALTDRAVDRIIIPTIDDVLNEPRFDVISLGFVLALWSGSRALNVFIDTITVMHGLGGHRGIVKTRALSFLLYILAMITGVVTVPLVVAGPTLVRRVLPNRSEFLMTFYWPTIIVICICFLATLYHVSVPVRTNWSFNLPRRDVRARGLGGGLGAAAVGAHRHRCGLPVDLRAAGGADRRTAVAVPPGPGRADRRRGQRGLRLRLPAEVDHACPTRTRAATAASDDHPGRVGRVGFAPWLPTGPTRSRTDPADGSRCRRRCGHRGGSWAAGFCWPSPS